MSNLRRVMWNGTVRALPLAEQLRATQLAGCEALTITPSDYVTWLAHSTTTSTRADILATLQATGGLNNCGVELFSPHNDRLSADAIGSACKQCLDMLVPQPSLQTKRNAS